MQLCLESLPNYVGDNRLSFSLTHLALHCPNRHFNGDVVRISTLAYFRLLMVALIFTIPLGVWYFCFVLFSSKSGLGRCNSSDFYLALSTVTVLPPWIEEPMWGFWQFYLMFVPSIYFGLRRTSNGSKIVLEVTWVQTPFITWPT